jgi:hypothetical protein
MTRGKVPYNEVILRRLTRERSRRKRGEKTGENGENGETSQQNCWTFQSALAASIAFFTRLAPRFPASIGLNAVGQMRFRSSDRMPFHLSRILAGL